MLSVSSSSFSSGTLGQFPRLTAYPSAQEVGCGVPWMATYPEITIWTFFVDFSIYLDAWRGQSALCSTLFWLLTLLALEFYLIMLFIPSTRSSDDSEDAIDDHAVHSSSMTISEFMVHTRHGSNRRTTEAHGPHLRVVVQGLQVSFSLNFFTVSSRLQLSRQQ